MDKIGEYFVEQIDNDYGIFHTDKNSGYCYELYASQEEAKKRVNILNKGE